MIALGTPRLAPAPPATLAYPVNSADVPPELVSLPHWVAWQWEFRDGEWTKPPINPRTGTHADCADPATWGAFGEAVACAQRRRLAGVGVQLTESMGIVGIDVDKCRDATTGALDPWAHEIVERFGTFTQISPSGRGLRLFLKARFPAWLEGRLTGKKTGKRTGRIEFYRYGRYLTLTAERLKDTPPGIEERQAAFDAWAAELFPQESESDAPHGAAAAGATGFDDAEVVRRCESDKGGEAFRRLFFNGDTSAHDGNDSSADLALCDRLRFYSGDRSQVDRLFRRSGLYRAKWDRADYRTRTLEKAMGGEVYSRPLAVDLGEAVSGARRADAASPRRTERKWPEPPGAAAFSGLAGRLVEAADPFTEGDRAAVLGHTLAAFGIAVGSGPYAQVGATTHPVRDNWCLVGRTSKARKGDSWTPVAAVMRLADPEWMQGRVMNGLSSGEGLIHSVRDQLEQHQAIKEKGRTIDYEMVVTDEGVTDKRLFVLESEFARTLRVMNREGNTLSAILREAWDGAGNLRVMTKAAVTATGAHVGVFGHITVDEVRREMNDISATNGFANRFVWLCARRSKELPEPEIFGETIAAPLATELGRALAFARTVGCLERDGEARELWRAVYSDLSAERDGLAGGILARAEAHVLRLSMLYALLDCSAVVRAEHLESALELWAFAQRSVTYIFGDATGDAIADTIERALAASGEMTRTAITNLFARNESSTHIARALQTLLTSGKARMTTREPDGGKGRSVEIWHALANDGLNSFNSFNSSTHEPPYLAIARSFSARAQGATREGNNSYTSEVRKKSSSISSAHSQDPLACGNARVAPPEYEINELNELSQEPNDPQQRNGAPDETGGGGDLPPPRFAAGALVSRVDEAGAIVSGPTRVTSCFWDADTAWWWCRLDGSGEAPEEELVAADQEAGLMAAAA